MSRTVQQPPPYTVEKLGPEHDHRVESRVVLASHRGDPDLTVTVGKGHAAVCFTAYWTSFRVAMRHDELVALRDAITAALATAGIETAPDAADDGEGA